MHCFSGSFETAQICIDMGLYIAFEVRHFQKRQPSAGACS